ncbi:D-lactate dehydrogenase (cytochrome) [[Candida] zeylanoides]
MFRNTFTHLRKSPRRKWYSQATAPRARQWQGAIGFGSGIALGGVGVYYAVSNFDRTVAPAPDWSSTLALDRVESPQYGSPGDLERAIAAIRQIGEHEVPIRVTDDHEQLESHSDTYFKSHHPTPSERPKYVVYPKSTQQVAQVLRVCHQHAVPVVPISGASSLEGHFIPTRGGISIDLSGMDKVIRLNKDDLDVVVQSGVGWEDLADYLEPHGLMFGPDPGPGADIGGMCATNCSGTNAFKYGECYKNILSLTVVLADGTVVKTRQRPRKSSAGYNITSLFIGSEGTLGVITEATLRLHVKPKYESIVVVPFKRIDQAANAVNSILKSGIDMNAIELLDDKMMHCINASGQTTRKWTELPTLFLKVGGPSQQVASGVVDELRTLTARFEHQDFIFASDEEEKTELWAARKVALWSTIDQGKVDNKDIQLWTTDAAVPVSNLARFLTETKRDIDDHGLQNTLVAHIGDGNAHSFILYDPGQRQLAEEVVDNMVRRALAYEGTCTGEHGVGLGKRDFLLEEVGQAPVDLMRRIKLAIDPKRILNPDKIFRIDPNEPSEHRDHGDTQSGEPKNTV